MRPTSVLKKVLKMIDKIKQLRDESGASIGEIRAALEESGGDSDQAKEILKQKFGAMAERKSGREVKAGVVDAYIHANGRIGVIVELQCETDFVARNGDFRRAAHDIAMQIAATAPADHRALYAQEFIRDPARKVGDLIQELIGKFGENVKVGKFVRFEL